ncbi:PASTA domain-containing protein [Streptomyces sp. x-80]|uniref:PASTA domain-containing protein n=1 Tax=Streptomyces sp. x-80 TaxID=2789282 RepID=UPI00397F5449
MTPLPPDGHLGDPRHSGRLGHPGNHSSAPGPGPGPDFGKALMQAMDHFANDAPAPVLDGTAILRRTRRRRGLLAAAASAAAIALTAGTAFALHSADRPADRIPAAAPGTTTTPAAGDSHHGSPSRAPDTTAGPGRATVPALLGLPRAAAEKALAKAGLRVGTVHDFTDWRTPAGAVISTEPRPGTVVSPDTAIDLFVSKGKP